MGIDVSGWIEVERLPGSDTHAWWGLIDLSKVIDCTDEVSHRCWGVVRAHERLPYRSAPAHAADRGLPVLLSEAAARELEDCAPYANEMFGHTHATWAEMKTWAIPEAALADSGWATAFDFARVLERRFDATRIRMVVWFSI